MVSEIIKSIFKPAYRPFRNRYENRLIEILDTLSDIQNHQRELEEKYAFILNQCQGIEKELGIIHTYLKENLSQKIAGCVKDTAGQRIWDAEKSIIQAMDARIWRGERNLLSAIDLQAYRNQKLMPQNGLARLTVHLVEHCNLNCQCCDNFSPLAEREYADLEKMTNDFEQLKKLGGCITLLELSGGEALLHPQICDFVSIARKYFGNSTIRIVSNGILLPKMPDEFWIGCAQNNVSIMITKYPVDLNFDIIKEKAKTFGVNWRFFDESTVKTTYHIPFDIQGNQHADRNFVNCFHANSCVCLQNGRIYTCSIAANVRHFNKYFDENLPDVLENSISIYEARSMQEILTFISRPIPLCQYCDVTKRRFGLPWDRSRRKKGEWVSFVENEEDKFEFSE